MKENKKILIWDGIFQGHKYITEEEMRDRKILQEKMMSKLWGWVFIFILFTFLFLGIVFWMTG